MLVRMATHALSSQFLLPQSVGERLLIMSIIPQDAALKFLAGEGREWTSDVEIRRKYIDCFRNAEHFVELRDFCDSEIQRGTDDWAVVQGWIDGMVGCFPKKLPCA
jgi:hypothetical protein